MINSFEFFLLTAAVIAILAVGSLHVRSNLWLYSACTLSIAIATALYAKANSEIQLFYVAGLIAVLKAGCIPFFLNWITQRLQIKRDLGITPPLSMHFSIFLFALSYLLASQLPPSTNGSAGAVAGISLILTGLLLMLTRRLAISQILGFLIIENGIFVFAINETRGMPLFVEMGIMLDVLVGVMISGLLIFSIQKSFEHIDVTQLTDLRD